MSINKISKRYAKALFDFAIEQNMLENIKADMDYLFQLCFQSKEFVGMLKSPVIKVSKKIEIISSLISKHVSVTTLGYLKIITNNHREKIIPKLADQFLLMYKDFVGQKDVTIYEAHEINSETIKQIQTILENQTNKKINICEKIDESLIGGFILEIDDLQFDASIKYKLERLKNDLAKEY